MFINCIEIKAALHRAFKVRYDLLLTTYYLRLTTYYLLSRRQGAGLTLTPNSAPNPNLSPNPNAGPTRGVGGLTTYYLLLTANYLSPEVWEDMHQHIQFVDVTEECCLVRASRAGGLGVPPS